MAVSDREEFPAGLEKARMIPDGAGMKVRGANGFCPASGGIGRDGLPILGRRMDKNGFGLLDQKMTRPGSAPLVIWMAAVGEVDMMRPSGFGERGSGRCQELETKMTNFEEKDLRTLAHVFKDPAPAASGFLPA